MISENQKKILAEIEISDIELYLQERKILQARMAEKFWEDLLGEEEEELAFVMRQTCYHNDWY